MTSPTPTVFTLLLGVSSKRGSRSRALWSSRVAPLGSSEISPVFEDDAATLAKTFGVPCSLGLSTQVPRDLIGPMSAAMHLAMAIRLRASGDRQGAEAIEHVWAQRRANQSSRR